MEKLSPTAEYKFRLLCRFLKSNNLFHEYITNIFSSRNPDSIRNHFFQNLHKGFLDEIISDAFCWDNTPQGDMLWYDVYKKWKKFVLYQSWKKLMN